MTNAAAIWEARTATKISRQTQQKQKQQRQPQRRKQKQQQQPQKRKQQQHSMETKSWTCEGPLAPLRGAA